MIPLLLPLLIGCGAPDAPPAPPAPDPAWSPTARPDLHETLLADAAAPRGPADGGGRAWMDPASTDPATAGAPGRFTVIYEAGARGVAVGGAVSLQVSPFWGWSPPQLDYSENAGYTVVTAVADGVVLDVAVVAPGLVAAHIGGRALAPGERVRFDYGAGPAGARADRFAEHASPFWVAVDGDGDGVRGLVTPPPTVEVAPAGPARLVLSGPSSATPGQPVALVAAVLDGGGSGPVPMDGALRFAVTSGEGALSLTEAPLSATGRATLTLTPTAPGVVRVTATGPDGLSAVSNPLLVAPDAPRWLWADLHGHSALSDGTGTPDDYFRYARDVAALDVAALTDHDHWGMEPLASHPERKAEIWAAIARFHEDERFVTLPGFEWTSWLYGHRHVLWFEAPDAEHQQIVDSVSPAGDSPAELWDALRGAAAMTIAHHSAGGPVAMSWSIPPDPELEPVTEVSSVHGSSEALDSPGLIYDPVPGNTVRDALGRGYRLGMVGSGDSHDGHPGLAHLATGQGGLAAIQADALTRDAVLAALRARRVYATNGPRIALRATLAGHPMGSAVPAAEAAAGELVVLVAGTGPLERLDLVRTGQLAGSIDCAGGPTCGLRWPAAELVPGDWVYVRAVQSDGGAAWSSPFWVE